MGTDHLGTESPGGGRLPVGWGFLAALVVTVTVTLSYAASPSPADTYLLLNPLDRRELLDLKWNTSPGKNQISQISSSHSLIQLQPVIWLNCNISRRIIHPSGETITQNVPQMHIGIDVYNSRVINLENQEIDMYATVGEAMIIFSFGEKDNRVLFSIDRYDRSIIGASKIKDNNLNTISVLWKGKCEIVGSNEKKF